MHSCFGPFRIASVVVAFILLAGGAPPATAAIPSPDEVAAWVVKGQLDKLPGKAILVQISDMHMTSRDMKSLPRRSPDILRATLKEIATHYPKARFVVSTGDNGPEGSYASVVRESTLPQYVVPGNHDTGLDTRTRYPKLFPFTVRSGNLRCYFLDTRLPDAWVGNVSPEQIRKLHEALSADAGQVVFLFGHHDAHQGLINGTTVHEVLKLHRPRYRGIIMGTGHWHRPMHFDDDGVIYAPAPSLHASGAYRVFHVGQDAVIYYDRMSEAWTQMRQCLGQPVETLKIPIQSGILFGQPVVMPLSDTQDAKPLPASSPDYQRLAKTLAGPKTEPPVGTVLDLRFDEGKGPWARDASGYQNDLCMADRSTPGRRFNGWQWYTKLRLVSPWFKRDGGFAIGFGAKGAGGGVAYYSETLDSPAKTHRLTVGADLKLPAEGPGWAHIIADKATWGLHMDKGGAVTFTVKLTKGMPVSVTSDKPLPREAWCRVTGLFDGKQVRLFFDARQVAAGPAPPQSKLPASLHPLKVGFFAKPAWATKDGKREYLPAIVVFEMDNLRISNKAEVPGT